MAAELIGRDHPVGVLRAEIVRATDSHGGLVLVTGEAGIGKTTLVTDAMDVARHSGALVLSGSCWDSAAAPGLWPWVQVIRALRRHATEAEWSAAGEQLSFLLGEGDGAASEPDDGFQMYDAVTSALVAVSQRRPVAVVLDDLHWADPPSVRLLEFVAQHTWFERLLLIATYRDVEVEAADHPLAPLMLPLVAKAKTVTLTGLDRDDVGALITRTVGDVAEPGLVAEVHRRTGGNPFFVEQTARLWHSGGELSGVAPGVRDAVRRRLSLLPEMVSRLLSAAAVLGREFHRQVLAETVAVPAAQVDRLLSQAVAARLVTALGDGTFAFAHDLVRETLYSELAEAEVSDRHAAVVRALDRAPALRTRVFPADVARHAYLARAALDRDTVVDLLVAAAKDAGNRAAFEEAAGHYERAIGLLERTEPRRAKISLKLGQQLYHLGQKTEAWAIFQEAADIALASDDADLLTRVALTLYSMGGTDGRAKLKADLLRAAHTRLVADFDPADFRSIDHMAQELIMQTIAAARQGGDDDALGFSLWTRHDTLWGPGNAAERMALTDELAAVARRTGETDMEQYAVSFGWVAAVELNDPRYVERYRKFIALNEANPPSTWAYGSYVDRAIISTFHGRFADATAELGHVSNLPEEHPSFTYMLHHLEWALLLPQGRYDELAELNEKAAAVRYPLPALLTGLTAAHRGDAATAVRCLAEVEAGEQPSNTFHPVVLRLRAATAALTADPARCEQALAELEPYAGMWFVSLYGCDIGGPAAYWVAMVQAALRRWPEAIEAFTTARRQADRMSSPPWSVEAKAGLAKALLGRGTPDDKREAAALRREVTRDATRLGMRHHGTTTPSTVDATAVNEFRYTGEMWSLSMGGTTVHVPDAKGLRDLHVLLASPGVEIPATRLLNPDGGTEVVAASSLSGDDMLDDEAKAAYRRRLAQLDEHIDEATSRGDDRRAATFDDERAALLTELRSAAGLGGRTRRLGDEAERARKTVTARIRDTLRKLDDRHPELASHLREAVATGSVCSYNPPSVMSWQL